MIGRVIVMEPNDYQAWLSGGGGMTMVQRGEQLFQQLACVSCHVTDGSGRGPSLSGVFGSEVTLSNGTTVVADDTYIRESILMPQTKLVAGYQAVMPTFQGQVNEEGVMSLIEYVKSLQTVNRPSGGAAPQASAAPAGPQGE
jgi:cytochrome c oxidase subunit 2